MQRKRWRLYFCTSERKIARELYLQESCLSILWRWYGWQFWVPARLRTGEHGVCEAGMKRIANTSTIQTYTINAGIRDLMAWGYNIKRARCSGSGKQSLGVWLLYRLKKNWWFAWDWESNSCAWASWLIRYDKHPFLTQEIRQEGQVIQR